MEGAGELSELDAAQYILHRTSDRDVLGLSQSGPLTREGIQRAFHTRVLHLHPDKSTAAGAPQDASTNIVGAAFGKLVEARDRLLELLPLSQLLWQQQHQQQQRQHSVQAPGPSQLTQPATSHDVAPHSPFADHITAPATSHASAVLTAAPSPFANEETDAVFFSSNAPPKCRTFGCLRTLTIAEAQAHEPLCLYCRTRPRKCAVFGCLRMTTGDAYCSEHRK